MSFKIINGENEKNKYSISELEVGKLYDYVLAGTPGLVLVGFSFVDECHQLYEIAGEHICSIWGRDDINSGAKLEFTLSDKTVQICNAPR